MSSNFPNPPLSSGLPVTQGIAQWPKPWGNWFSLAWQVLFAVKQSGTTAQRPANDLWAGRTYFDTTLAIPIWWDAAAAVWVDATGTPV